MNLTVKMEKTSEIQRKLTITVPAEEVTNRLEKGFVDVQKKANLKGFRPGQAPIAMVKQMYGQDVRHQALHDLIEESYRLAVSKEKLRAVGNPSIDTSAHKTGAGDHDHGVEEGKDLTFTATVEIVPEIKVKDYTGLSLKKPKGEVTDDDVKKVIDYFLDSQSQLIPATGGLLGADGSSSSRAARMGDFADVEFNGKLKNETGEWIEGQGMKGSRLIELGSNSLIPGFEENLVGMKASDEKTFEINFPDDYHAEDIKGKPAQFYVKVLEVKEKKMPALDDEFAKQVGYESVLDMRVKAREHLIREKEEESARAVRSDLLTQLIEKNPFDVPNNLVMAQTRALAEDLASSLKQQGYQDPQIQQAIGMELENLKKRAEGQVRASLILETISKKESVDVSQEEIDVEISKIAVAMKVEEPKLREFYQKNPHRYDDLTYKLKEERTIKYLIEKAKVKEA